MTANNMHDDWWKQAVVYQVYPRSFRDANGDGLGDIAGITEQVPYLKHLGVDAIWLSPFYPSELADGGYDVIDYRNVDPRLGTLEDFDELVTALHAHGMKIVVDIVPNHTSNMHEWFQAALTAEPGSPERDRYIFREGRGRCSTERLAVAVRGAGLATRGRRPMVSAHLHSGAAGPQLEEPRGA